MLSYVYDHGRPELDELAAAATTAFLPVNGLDPTTFTSVATLERDIVAFTREVLHGQQDVVGSVTSGGTESCLLAVKSARDIWFAQHGEAARLGARPALVMPTTGHPAFRKACHYFGLELHEVPVDVTTGAPLAADVLACVTDLTETGAPPALVVLSAPNYPFGVLDPIEEVATALTDDDTALHVDACIGGWLLPWWPHADEIARWDFALPGVTSISTDLHKYGFAPKGTSVVLYRQRLRHRAQYFATSHWPGYPVVNPTVLGSRSATALAAAWAITQALGAGGYAELVAKTARATRHVHSVVRGIEGLHLFGQPAAGLFALAADETLPPQQQVDPFVLVDRARDHGFLLQAQPALTQEDGTVLPRTAHLTLTPVSDDGSADLGGALAAAADDARGHPAPKPDADLVSQVMQHGLPTEMAGVMSTLEALPDTLIEEALTDVLARVIDPD